MIRTTASFPLRMRVLRNRSPQSTERRGIIKLVLPYFPSGVLPGVDPLLDTRSTEKINLVRWALRPLLSFAPFETHIEEFKLKYVYADIRVRRREKERSANGSQAPSTEKSSLLRGSVGCQYQGKSNAL